MSRLRTAGADLQLGDSRTATLPADAPIDIVYDPPTSDRERQWRADIFEAAQEAWHLNDIAAQPLGEFHARAAVSAGR